MRQKTRSLLDRQSATIEPLERRSLFSGSAPVAMDDLIRLPVNLLRAPSGVTEGSYNVLANDRDAESDALSATLIWPTAHGAFSFNRNGTFSYTPPIGFVGVDTFAYLANDGTTSSKVAYVTIVVGTPPQTSSITGSIYNDANRNGRRDITETGVAGRTVFIDSNGNQLLDNGEVRVKTDSTGRYLFTGLSGGAYRVSELLPAGATQTAPGNSASQAALVGRGQLISGRDFGVWSPPPPGAIKGAVFLDLNRNCSQQAEEPGLGGWKVFLDRDNDGICDSDEASALTDSSGKFSFTNLRAGVYHVREIVAGGWQRTSPYMMTVSVAAGVTSKVQFGDISIQQLASIPGASIFSAPLPRTPLTDVL